MHHGQDNTDARLPNQGQLKKVKVFQGKNEVFIRLVDLPLDKLPTGF